VVAGQGTAVGVGRVRGAQRFAERPEAALHVGGTGGQDQIAPGAAGGGEAPGHGAGGGADGDVAGAAAQVPLERLEDGGLVRVGPLQKETEQRHDDAGRAVAALDGVVVQKLLLDHVESPVGGQPLHRDDMSAVQPGGRQDAAVDGSINEQLVRQLAQGHGARAAVALGTGLLRACKAQLAADHLQRRPVGGDGHPNLPVIEEERDLQTLDGVGHGSVLGMTVHKL